MLKKSCIVLLIVLAVFTSYAVSAEEENAFVGRWCEEEELGATFTFYSDGSCEGAAMFCDVKGSYTVSGDTMTMQVTATIMAGLEKYMANTFSTVLASQLNNAVFTLQDSDTIVGAEMTLKRDASYREAKIVYDGKLEGLWEKKDAAGDLSQLALYFCDEGIMYAMSDGMIFEKSFQHRGNQIVMGKSGNTISATLQEDGSLDVPDAGKYVKTLNYEPQDFSSIAGFYLSEEINGVYSGYYLTSTGSLLSMTFEDGKHISWSVRERGLTMVGNRIGAHDELGNRFYASIQQGIMTEERWTINSKRKWVRGDTSTYSFAFTEEEIAAVMSIGCGSESVEAEVTGTWLSDDGQGDYLVIYPDGSGLMNDEKVDVKAAEEYVLLNNADEYGGFFSTLTYEDGKLIYQTQGQTISFTRRASIDVASIEQETNAELFCVSVVKEGIVICGLKDEVKECVTELIIPSNMFGLPVVAIGDSVFENNWNITSVVIGEGINAIGDNAFCDCRALETVAFPGTVTTIGAGAFQSTWALQEVRIPASVTAIGDHAFDCSGITQLTLEKGLRNIGQYAFSECKMKNLILPEGLESVGAGAFYACASLSEVEIGEGLKELRGQTFGGCSSPKIKMPMSLETISSEFAGDARPRLIVYEDSAAEEFAKNNPYKIWSYEVVPYGASAAVNEADFIYYVLEDGTAYIAGWKGNDTELVIPGTLGGYPVSVIGEKVFLRNKTITSVVIPEGIRLIKTEAFGFCEALQSVTLPSTLVCLEKGAFYYSEVLGNVNLPEGLQTIGEKAFAGCPLVEVVLPATLKMIGEGAFGYMQDRRYFTTSVAIDIPSTLDEVGDEAFASSYTLVRARISDASIRLGESMFSNCICLSSVELPQDMTHLPKGFLANTDSLRSITLPESLTSIPDSVFFSSGLKEITIPASVTSVGYQAFSWCEKLTTVTFIGAPKLISERAFEGCETLEKIILPEGVERIGAFAFSSCQKLHTISIPESVQSIADNMLLRSDSVVVEVKDGSYAHQWAIRNNVPYVVVDRTTNLLDLFGGSVEGGSAPTKEPAISALYEGCNVDKGLEYYLQLNEDYTYSYYTEPMLGSREIGGMKHEGTYELKGNSIVLTSSKGNVIWIETDSLRSFRYECSMSR